MLAAYNAGEGNVTKWLADSRYSDGDGKLKDIPFSETRRYVAKVNEAMDMYMKLYEMDKSMIMRNFRINFYTKTVWEKQVLR